MNPHFQLSQRAKQAASQVSAVGSLQVCVHGSRQCQGTVGGALTVGIQYPFCEPRMCSEGGGTRTKDGELLTVWQKG